MKSDDPVVYIQKKYCLYIKSITFQQKIKLFGFSRNFGETDQFEAKRNCIFDGSIFVSCVDIAQNHKIREDCYINLFINDLLNGEQMENIGCVNFNMNEEKIVRPDSPHIFTKELIGKKGIINYKFINIKTKSITQKQFQSFRKQRGNLSIRLSELNRIKCIESLKSELVSQRKVISELQIENQKIKYENHEQNNMKDERVQNLKLVNLSIKVNSNLQKIKKQNNQYKQQIQQLKQKIFNSDKYIKELKIQNDFFIKQINLLKEQIREAYNQSESNQDFKTNNKSFLLDPNFITNSTKMKTSRHIYIDGTTINQKRQYLKNKELQQLNSTVKRFNDESLQQPLKKSQVFNLKQLIQNKKSQIKRSMIIKERQDMVQILQQKLAIRQNQIQSLHEQLLKLKKQIKIKNAEAKSKKLQSIQKNLLNSFDLGLQNKYLDKQSIKVQIQTEMNKLIVQFQSQKRQYEDIILSLQKQRDKLSKECSKFNNYYEQQKIYRNKYSKKCQILKTLNQQLELKLAETLQKSLLYDQLEQKQKLKTQNEAQFMNLIKKLQNQIKQLKDSKKQYLTRQEAMRQQLMRLKQIQVNYQSINQRCKILYMKNQSLKDKINELQTFCKKTKEYSDRLFVAKQGSHDKSFVNQLIQTKQQKQFTQNIVNLNQKVNEMEKEVVKSQIDVLAKEKQLIAKHFQSLFKIEATKIQNLNNLSQTEKLELVRKKEEEIINEGHMKLQQINIKISEAKQRQEEIIKNNIINQEMIRLNPFQRMGLIQTKIEMMKSKSLHSSKSNQNLKSSNHSVDFGVLGLSKIILATSNQLSEKRIAERSALQEQFQQKTLNFIAQLQKSKQGRYIASYDQVRQAYVELQKKYRELEIKNLEYTIKSERILNKNQQRQAQMQIMARKVECDFKIALEEKVQQINKLQKQKQNLNIIQKDLEQSLSLLKSQIEQISSLLDHQILQNNNLLQKVTALQKQLADYELGERQMIYDVNKIKQKMILSEQQLKLLLEDQQLKYLQLQRIKNIEIKKLICEFEKQKRLYEEEIFQNISLKKANEALKVFCERLQSKIQQMKVQYSLTIQNKSIECANYKSKNRNLQAQIEIIQNNIFQISKQINEKDRENAENIVKIKSLEKLIDIYKIDDFSKNQNEKQLKYQIKQLKNTIQQNKKKQLYFQQKFLQIQLIIDTQLKQRQRTLERNEKMCLEIEKWRQQNLKKHDQILQLKQKLALLQIKQNQQRFTLLQIKQSQQKLKENQVEKHLMAHITPSYKQQKIESQKLIKIDDKTNQNEQKQQTMFHQKQQVIPQIDLNVNEEKADRQKIDIIEEELVIETVYFERQQIVEIIEIEQKSQINQGYVQYQNQLLLEDRQQNLQKQPVEKLINHKNQSSQCQLLRYQISNLKQLIEKNQKQKNLLKQQLQKYQNKYTNLKQKYQCLQIKISKQKRAKVSFRNSGKINLESSSYIYSQLQKKYQNLQNQFSETKHLKNRAQIQLAHAKNAIDILNNRVDDLNKTLDIMKVLIANQQKQKQQNLQQLYHMQVAKNQSITKNYELLINECSQKDGKITELVKQNIDINHKHCELKQKNRELKDLISKMQLKIKTLQRLAESNKNKYNQQKYQEAINSMNLKNTQLLQAIEIINQLKVENQQKDKIISNYYQINSNIQHSFHQVENNFKAYQSKFYIKNQQMEVQKQKISAIELQNKKLRNECHQLKYKYQQLFRKYQSSQQLVQKFKLQIISNHQKKQSQFQVIERFISKINQKTSQPQQKVYYIEKQELFELKMSKEVLQKQNKDLKIKNHQLQEINKKYYNQSLKFTDKLDQLHTSFRIESDSLKLQIKFITQKLSEKNIEIKNQQPIISNLKELIEKMQNDNKKKNNQLNQSLLNLGSHNKTLQMQIAQLNLSVNLKQLQIQKLSAALLDTDRLRTMNQSKQLNLKQLKMKYNNQKQKNQKLRQKIKAYQKQVMSLMQRPEERIYNQLLQNYKLLELRYLKQQNETKRLKDIENKQSKLLVEYNKYKISKQIELEDLKKQLQRYDQKVNYLEESNFYLKREIQNLDERNQNLQRYYEKNQYEYEQKVKQFSEELTFYKSEKKFSTLKKLKIDDYLQNL